MKKIRKLDRAQYIQRAAFDKWSPADIQNDQEKWARSTAIWTLTEVAERRYHEIATALHNNEFYQQLSEPTYDNGAIDSFRFVMRMMALEDTGYEAKTMDLWQALMRTVHPEEDEIQMLRRMKSKQAQICADFFAAGGMNQLSTSWSKVSAEEVPHRPYKDKYFNVPEGKVADVYVSLTHLSITKTIFSLKTIRYIFLLLVMALQVEICL